MKKRFSATSKNHPRFKTHQCMSPLSQMSTNLLDWAFVAIIFSCGRYKEVPSCHVINRNLEVFSSNSHDCKVWLLLSLNWEDLKVVKRTISYSNVKPILRTLSLLPNVGSEIYYCFSIRILSSFPKKCEILECCCYEILRIEKCASFSVH